MYWFVNASRSLVILITIVVVIYVADHLDRVVSIAGAIFGMTNVLLLPALCHLKLIAETRLQRAFDYSLIVFSISMLIFGPATIVTQWYKNS